MKKIYRYAKQIAVKNSSLRAGKTARLRITGIMRIQFSCKNYEDVEKKD